MKKCLNEKALIISTLLIFSIMLFVPHFAFAGTFVDTICNMIAGVIFFFGEATVYLIDKLGGQFDKLLFNYDGSTFQNDLNLMILKSGIVS